MSTKIAEARQLLSNAAYSNEGVEEWVSYLLEENAALQRQVVALREQRDTLERMLKTAEEVAKNRQRSA